MAKLNPWDWPQKMYRINEGAYIYNLNRTLDYGMYIYHEIISLF